MPKSISRRATVLLKEPLQRHRDQFAKKRSSPSLFPLSLPRFGAPRACTVRPGSHRAFPPDVSDKGVVGTSHCHELEGRSRHRAVPGNARGRADRSLVGAEDALLDHVRRYSHIFLKLMTLWPDRERLGPTPRCAAAAPCIPPGGPRRWSAPIAFVVTLKRDGGNVCGRERNLTYLGAGEQGPESSRRDTPYVLFFVKSLLTSSKTRLRFVRDTDIGVVLNDLAEGRLDAARVSYRGE